MKSYVNLLRVCVLLSALALPCGAQETKPFTLQFNLDLRARLASTGDSKATAYQNSVALSWRLAPGLHFRYEGGQMNAPMLTGFGARFNHIITQEAALEKEWGAGNRAQLGIVRLPFGLYDSRETYASGLIDYPLLRGDYALQSVNWGVPGIRIGGSNKNFQAEMAVFGGQSAGMWNNLNNTQGVAGRLQFYHKDLILGVSHWNGSQSTSFASGGPQDTHITGMDIRYTRPHLLLRGELLTGTLAGEKATGWYLDAYYHLPKYQKWTLVTRAEAFQPENDRRWSKQLTFGVRYTLDSNWILAMNWRRNNGLNYRPGWTPPTSRSGEFFFQVYRKLNF